jgi:hypothetical protein
MVVAESGQLCCGYLGSNCCGSFGEGILEEERWRGEFTEMNFLVAWGGGEARGWHLKNEVTKDAGVLKGLARPLVLKGWGLVIDRLKNQSLTLKFQGCAMQK